MDRNPDDKRRSAATSRAGDGGAGPNNHVAAKLKAFYSAVEQEPIPDLFLDLLEKLAQVEGSTSGRNK